jgi:hypothetical protein
MSYLRRETPAILSHQMKNVLSFERNPIKQMIQIHEKAVVKAEAKTVA